MEHDKALERLDEWLDGELEAEESASLSRHLDGCEACRKEAALRKRLGESLFAPLPAGGPLAASHPAKNEAFVARVMARVEAESAPLWTRLLGRALTPALGLGLAALLFSVMSPGLASAFDGWETPEIPLYAEAP